MTLRRMTEIRYDISNAAGGTRESSEIRAEAKRDTMTYRRVESGWDECSEYTGTPCTQALEDVGDLEVEEFEERNTECVQYRCEATAMMTSQHDQQL